VAEHLKQRQRKSLVLFIQTFGGGAKAAPDPERRALLFSLLFKFAFSRLSFGLSCLQDPGRIRVVNSVFTAGTTQACSGGQPASVLGFRQRNAVALLKAEGSAAPFSGSA